MELSKLMVFLVEANAIAFRVPYFYSYIPTQHHRAQHLL